jgi:hypothetical protein
LCGGRDSRNLIVYQDGYVVLHDSGTHVDRLTILVLVNGILELFIGLDDFEENVSEIVFRALVVVLDDGWADLWRRDWKDGADHPVRTTPVMWETHEFHVFIRDGTEKALDVFDFEWLTNLLSIVTSFPFCNNGEHALIFDADRFDGSTAIAVCLTASTDFSAECADFIPAGFRAFFEEMCVGFLVDKKFGATNTDTTECVDDVVEEL